MTASKKFYTQIRLPGPPEYPNEAATKDFVERQRDAVIIEAPGLLDWIKLQVINSPGDYTLPANIPVGKQIEVFVASATGARIMAGSNIFVDLGSGKNLTLERSNYVRLTAIANGQLVVSDFSLIPLSNGESSLSQHIQNKLVVLSQAASQLVANRRFLLLGAGDYSLPNVISAGDTITVYTDLNQVRLMSNGFTIRQLGAGNNLVIPPGFKVELIAVSSSTLIIAESTTVHNSGN